MASVMLLPGSVVSGGSGDYAWSDVANVNDSDTSYAYCADTGLDLPANSSTEFLDCTNFGFDIPTGSTIDGVRVRSIVQSVSPTIEDLSNKLIVGGVRSGNDKATYTWTGTKEFQAWGGSADLWGLSLTPAQVNASDFGFALQAHETAGTVSTVSVWTMEIEVFYTPPTPGTSESSVTNSSPATVVTNGWTNFGGASNEDCLVAKEDSKFLYSFFGPSMSPYLEMKDFGFAIPGGESINGIEVLIRKGSTVSGSAGLVDGSVKLIKGGAIVGSNKADYTNDWPNNVNDDFTYGGDGDLWDESWTDVDINSAGFGVAIRAYVASSSLYAVVDYVEIKVYYGEVTGGAGGGGGSSLVFCMGQTIADPGVIGGS